jgi:hypothetical protein
MNSATIEACCTIATKCFGCARMAANTAAEAARLAQSCANDCFQ